MNDLTNISLGVIGATGLVGRKVLEIIEEKYLFKSIFVSASEQSNGKVLEVGNKKYTLVSVEDLIAKKPHCVILASSAEVSKELAPIFVKNNIYVIDNSSQWRMNKDVKLIVPEINGHKLTKGDLLIANPNCSTIQLTMVLKPLHDALHIKRVIVSTYQAVSGSGAEALNQLFMEREQNVLGKDMEIKKVYAHNIDMNIIPHIDTFLDNGYTKEELKIINETKKILDDDKIKISATAVRIPIENVHCESVNIEFQEPLPDNCIKEVTDVLKKSEGVEVLDNFNKNEYPMPCNTDGSDLVKVGRIRVDLDSPNSINLWIAADNVRKGAATNALQIVELISMMK